LSQLAIHLLIGWASRTVKKFTNILTHYVETYKGRFKCDKLLNLEKEYRFRLYFNFLSERGNVSKNLKGSIVQNGFEIGGHKLIHDGKLLEHEQTVDKRAVKINSFIKDSNTLGFLTPATQLMESGQFLNF